MNLTDTFWLMTVFGEDLKFWGTVAVASLLKWLFTPRRQTWREAVAGIVAGASLAYYGTDWVIRTFDSLSEADTNIVIIGLVISGEHVVRALVSYGPKQLTKKLGLEVEEETKP